MPKKGRTPPMRFHSTLVATLLFTLATATAAAAQPARAAASPTCDRECLKLHVTQVLQALLKHDISFLPVAPYLRVTEDAVEKPLKSVGLVTSVTALRGYRQ